ncbi:MAG: HAMP domain-containing histidine kinase [Alphaproteobacteria bacterium]|nr:HAMP domain-containing histidine kinase [Alphaproteobacteria bacterium]
MSATPRAFALSFRARILGGAVLNALVAVALVWGSVTFVIDRVERHPPVGASAQMRAACLVDPVAWRTQQMAHLRVELLPADDAAVPAFLADVALDTPVDAPGTHGDIWQRLAPDGPCAVAHLVFERPDAFASAFYVGGALGVFLAVLVVGVASHRWTVTPLLARIERIRAAVADVGEQVYASPDDHLGDDLSAIAAGLDGSHARIVAARADLVERHQALEKYLAEIAHDLRTPLGSLVLAIQELAAERPGAVVTRATTEVAYLSSLVDNLHQATRLRHGLDARQGRVDLQELVQRVELRFQALGRARGVSVASSTPDRPVWVAAEPALLERAVGNVVHNATLHGGGNVAIVLDVGDDGFTLDVMDDGDGLPDAALADLAARTFRVDAARGRSMGLGVAITNEVVAQLGWRIQYGRGDDGGMCVHLEGPITA